jgi:hypothetical protein
MALELEVNLGINNIVAFMAFSLVSFATAAEASAQSLPRVTFGPLTFDNDGDGQAESDGDCDDTDSSIYDGAVTVGGTAYTTVASANAALVSVSNEVAYVCGMLSGSTLEVDGASNLTLNFFTNSGITAVSGGAGLRLINTSFVDIEGGRFLNSDNGIEAQGDSNTTIDGSVVVGNSLAGIYLDGVSSPTVVDSTVNLNGVGLEVNGVSFLDISGSSFNSNGDGMILRDTYVWMTDVDANNNTDVGISMEDSSGDLGDGVIGGNTTGVLLYNTGTDTLWFNIDTTGINNTGDDIEIQGGPVFNYGGYVSSLECGTWNTGAGAPGDCY